MGELKVVVKPEAMRQFDAFPKLPSTYKSRSKGGGLITVFVIVVSFLLVVNDIAEFLWGWPDYEFNVDRDGESFMAINVDMMVNTPCRYLSVDLRDALGDRLHLSDGFKRDGVSFDLGQAKNLKEYSSMLSARQAVAMSRRSRGLLDFWRPPKPQFKPTVNYQPDGSACRVYGSLEVKKVNGHGYASHTHTDHNEFSFGPYFPDITQPLDYSFEVAQDRTSYDYINTDLDFVAYQYFLTVVPTTFIAGRQKPLHTNQYSVTHYERVLEHNKGAPGIFFKFDLEPLTLNIHQRTTTCVGVIGGVWVCTGWSIKVGGKVVEVVAGPDKTQGIVAAEATGVKRRWGGGDLRARPNAGGTSPYISQANTPLSGTFSQAAAPFTNYYGSAPNSPIPNAGNAPPSPYMPPSPYQPTSPVSAGSYPAQNGFPPPSPRPSVPPSPSHIRSMSGLRNASINGPDGAKKTD
ncbi:hypothetical protein Clacol_002420 [Clathrus columnatus]|uniref:DUF1692-domain-containing protein n=1 Tax=Clathrus columnatus TaxID=1419009 RepID=A0AAV5A3M5_9AGAM|nr:hypothetical protein Clacol_002420 [Clathrus columnatus]